MGFRPFCSHGCTSAKAGPPGPFLPLLHRKIHRRFFRNFCTKSTQFELKLMFCGFSDIFIAVVVPVRMWARYRKSHRRIFRNFSTQSTHLDLKFMFGGFSAVLVALVAPVRKWARPGPFWPLLHRKTHRRIFRNFCTQSTHLDLKLMFGGFSAVFVDVVAPVGKWACQAHFCHFCTKKPTI